jgi:hypothetical protein
MLGEEEHEFISVKVSLVGDISGTCRLSYSSPCGHHILHAAKQYYQRRVSRRFGNLYHGSWRRHDQLTDLQANPTNAAQLISGLNFVFSTGETAGTLASSSGQEITINSNGTYSLLGAVPTGWGLNDNVSGGLQLDALGFVGPKHLIIGPSDGSNTFSNANGSIAGNKPHNPFLNQQATFVVDVPGVTAATTITGATFSFGTTEGTDRVVGTVPDEPSALLLLGISTGVLGLAGMLPRKINL